MIKLDPWTIALYRILDKITSGVRDPDRNHSLLKINKIAEWMTNESVVNPASRNFKDLTSLSVKSLYLEYLKYPNHSKQVNEQKLWNYSDAIKKNQEAADAYKLRKTGKQPFPYSELARNCVEEHLKIFFDYDIEYTVLESGMKVPYLDEGNNVTFKKVPTKKTKFSKGEQDRYYLAFYMRGELTPNVGMVSVS